MGRVDGKVALITGGAKGLGESHGRLLVKEGARVILTDLDEDNGQKVAGDIGANAIFVKHNVTDEVDWQAAIDAGKQAFGKIDVVVNNAGIVIPGSIEDMDLATFQKVMSINVDGVYLGCKYAVAAMKDHGGSIINMSSMAALKASPNLAAYNTSKAAVAMLTKSVALHAAQYGIRCNSIHPGTIVTPMVKDFVALTGDSEGTLEGMRQIHPVGFLGEPIDISNMVLYLASDESRFATGGEFVVDGGSSL